VRGVRGGEAFAERNVAELVVIPAAWWRAITARDGPRDLPAWSTYILPALGPLALFFMIVDLLIHPIFLADDSIQNYTHVWYISQQLFHHGRIPMRISALDSGQAVTFPYGFTPYMIGAFLFRVFGNWAVSFLMAVAVLGAVWAAGLARPIIRDPWFLLLFVANPYFIDAVYAFQFPTLWSTVFFFLFIWAFEGRRHVLAALLLWLTVSTHPIVGGAAAAAYGLFLLVLDRPKVRRLVLLAVPVGLALIPFYWMMLQTPALRENSLRTIVSSVADVLPRRGSILLLPFALTFLAPYVRRFYRPALAVAGMMVLGVVLFETGPLNQYHETYYGALHGSSDIYAAFFASPTFKPGANYRVLEPTEREDGMYYFVRHGAVLGNEFFSESVFRRNWSEQQYRCFTAFKAVDFVVIERAYQRHYHTDEQTLLRSLVSQARASVAYEDPPGRFTVYDIRRFARERQKPNSLNQCRLF
jgi:hypothetical protein